MGLVESNVESLCSIGNSTKTRQVVDYVGEKGIGFKSVFLVSGKPFIFSKGYSFSFSDVPREGEGNLGFLIPKWETIQIDWSQYQIPSDTTTVIALPLKRDQFRKIDDELRWIPLSWCCALLLFYLFCDFSFCYLFSLHHLLLLL